MAGFKYCDFEGRAGLSEYWAYHVGYAIWGGLLWLAVNVAGNNFTVLCVLCLLFLLSLPPIIAVNVRRMHDIGRPGSALYFDTSGAKDWQSGSSGANEYGPPPEGGDSTDEPSEANPEYAEIQRRRREADGRE